MPRPELTHSSLLEELNELLKDEEALVKSAALEALINLLDVFSEDVGSSADPLAAECRVSRITAAPMIPFLSRVFLPRLRLQRIFTFHSFLPQNAEVIITLVSQTKKTRVLPQLRSLCRDTPDAVVYALADKIGLLLTKLQPALADDKDSEAYFSFFKKIGTNADVELRRRCVFNLPAVVLALGMTPHKNLRRVLPFSPRPGYFY